MENLRSTRAIQREDVWQAADALLLDGKRPTIERVRQQIGRGSPNTVSPMLEEWFATLGPRMAQLKAGGIAPGDNPAGQGGAGVPPALAQAMQTVWDGAMEQAQADAQALVADERAQLNSERAALEEATRLHAQAQALAEQERASLEQALAVAHAQIKLQGARVADLEQAGRQKDLFATQQQQRLQAMEQELFANRKARDEADRQHAEQLRELQSAAQAQQHRALQEIDRARQESKQWMAAQRSEQEKLAKLEGEWQAERSALQSQMDERAQHVLQLQAQVQQQQQALDALQAQHAHQLALLAQQQDAALALLQAQLAQGGDEGTPAAAHPGRVPRSGFAQTARAARSTRKLGTGGLRSKRQ